MKENEWFRDQGMDDLLEANRAGTSALITRLGILCNEYLKETWVPNTLARFEDKREGLRKEFQALGVPAAAITVPETGALLASGRLEELGLGETVNMEGLKRHAIQVSSKQN